MRDNPQRLVHFEELPLQLLLEQCRLVCHAGSDAGLSLGTLDAGSTVRADPGQRDQRRGGGDDSDETDGPAAASQLHRPAMHGTSRSLLKDRHPMIG